MIIFHEEDNSFCGKACNFLDKHIGKVALGAGAIAAAGITAKKYYDRKKLKEKMNKNISEGVIPNTGSAVGAPSGSGVGNTAPSPSSNYGYNASMGNHGFLHSAFNTVAHPINTINRTVASTGASLKAMVHLKNPYKASATANNLMYQKQFGANIYGAKQANDMSQAMSQATQ